MPARPAAATTCPRQEHVARVLLLGSPYEERIEGVADKALSHRYADHHRQRAAAYEPLDRLAPNIAAPLPRCRPPPSATIRLPAITLKGLPHMPKRLAKLLQSGVTVAVNRADDNESGRLIGAMHPQGSGVRG